jgi:hypothetical protein
MKTNFKLVFSAILLSLTSAFAQRDDGSTEVKKKFPPLGVTLGVGAGAVEFGNLGGRRANETVSTKDILVLEGGVFLRHVKAPVFIKPALLFKSVNGFLDLPDDKLQRFNMQTLQVPLLIGFKVFGPWSVEVGPSYSFMLHTTKDLGEEKINPTRHGLGFRAGFGVNYEGFFMTTTYQRITYAAPGLRTSFKEPYQFVISAGYTFGEIEQIAKMDDKRYEFTPGR